MGRNGNGVEVRERSIRLKFVYQGETVRQTLTINGKAMLPTPANVKYANRLADEIRKKIVLGSFTMAEYFPDSRQAHAEHADAATFGKLTDLWLQSKGQMAAATRDQYGTAVRFWKRLLGEETLVGEITHKVLAAKIGSHPWPSAKTHNNYLIALRGVMALEYRGPASLHNPLIGIENAKVTKRLPDPLTIEERDKIQADLRKHYDERVYAYFLWQFFTGMRPEETIALRWSDVDSNAQIVRVQRVRTFRGHESDDTKTFVEREVDLLPQALDALAIMKKYTFMGRAERDGDEDTAADIFQNPVTKRSWHDERSQRDHYWRPSLKRLGIRWRRAYNTRHTYATEALMGGVPPGYVAHQLGHSTKMLHEKYARWIPGNDQGSARDRMRATMGRADSPPASATGAKVAA